MNAACQGLAVMEVGTYGQVSERILIAIGQDKSSCFAVLHIIWRLNYESAESTEQEHPAAEDGSQIEWL